MDGVDHLGQELERGLLARDIEDVAQGLAQALVDRAEPDRVDVAAHEVLVGEIEPRRADLPGHHQGGPAEEVGRGASRTRQYVKTSAGWPLRPARPERWA